MTAQVIGTPYGAPALAALRRVVAEHKRHDLLAPVTIIVPSTVAGTITRRHLARTFTPDTRGPEERRSGPDPAAAPNEADTGIAGIHLVTVPRLAEQLAATTLTGRRPATGIVVSAAWRGALNRDAGVFSAVKDHPATVTALLSAHRELRDLTADQLETVAGSGSLPGAVVELHRAVAESLRRSWYDSTDLLRAALTVVSNTPSRLDECGAIVLFLPQDLGNAEADLLRAIADRADMTVIAGWTGGQRADAGVERSLRRIGLSGEHDPVSTSIAHRVRTASDSDEEVRLVVRDVMQALRTTPAHRIAVLYASPLPYARLLHEQFAGSGIAANGLGVEPVRERAIARGMVGFLRLVGTDLPRADLFEALANAPVFADLGGFRGHDEAGRPTVPVARWERLSRSAGVVAGADWDDRLDRFADEQRAAADDELTKEAPSAGRIEAAQRNVVSAKELQRFVQALRARLAEGAFLHDWPALSQWAIDLFRDLYGGTESAAASRLPLDERYAAAAVEGILSGLAALSGLEPTANAMALVELLDQELTNTLPRVGRFGDGVFVGPMSAAVGLDVDRVFVLGLAEDSYPGRLHPDPLLSASTRRTTGGALAEPRDRLDASERHLLAAFAAAPQVQASFPRGNLRRSTVRYPSRWLLPTLRRLTGRDDLPATEWDSVPSKDIVDSPSYASELSRTEQLASEQEWRLRAMSAGNRLVDPIIDGGVEMVRARRSHDFTRFDGNLGGAADLPDFTAGSRTVSPTALESYADCPHGYFVKRMLGIEPIQQPEETLTISSLDVGILIHDAMDELVKKFAGRLPGYGEPWSDDQRASLQEIAARLAAVQEASGATGHPRLWVMERERILSDLAAMLVDDDEYRATHDAAVVESELSFGKDGQNPVTVDIPGGVVRMVGSADKVDRTRDGELIVTDIKTGGSQRYRKLRQDPVVAGTRLQLPVYAHAARQRLLGDRVRAQYWFVRKDRGTRIPIDLDDSVEQRYAETLGVLVGSIADGLFPAKAPESADFAWVQCPYCNPDGIGHADARERWERKRNDPALAELVSLIDPAAVETRDSDSSGHDSPGGRS
jgi:RecB family exonuclease